MAKRKAFLKCHWKAHQGQFLEKIRLEIAGTKLEDRVHTKMYNSKIWKHFKTLYIEMFQNQVEFKCCVCSSFHYKKHS